MRKNLKKYYEVSPDCTYADRTVVDNQVRERNKGTFRCPGGRVDLLGLL